MKRLLLVVAGMLCGASVLSAQYVKPEVQNGANVVQMTPLDGKTVTVVVGPTVLQCPVALRAKQGSGGGLVATRNAPPVGGPAQRIRLEVADSKSGRVSSARIRVYGMSGKGRMQKTDSEQNWDFVRTMQVEFSQDDEGAAADLMLRGFTAVNKIVVQTLTYQDGSTWTPMKMQMCSVAPDPFMLVAGR